MTWTVFHDMHSGGYQKTDYEVIFVEASEELALEVFRSVLGLDPTNESCRCCGEDFSFDESEDLLQATAYYRYCTFDTVKNRYNDDGQHLDEYILSEKARFIRQGEF